MSIFTVIFFLVLTYDLRTLSEPIELPKTREESPGVRVQNDLSDGVTTGRDARDVGSASFAANVYPVQVDLTEWTRKFERKFEDFTKLVDLRFNVLDSQMKGFEDKFNAIDRRQNETEKLTSTRFEEVKERINQFESRLNDSKTETEARLKELETRINDSCCCPTEMPDSSTSLRPTGLPDSWTSLRPVTSTPSGTCVKIRVEASLDSNKRYKEFNGKCYLFYPNSGLPWGVDGENARTYCQGLGADLIAVETSAENEFIKRVVDVEESDMPNSDYLWVLGAKRSEIGQPLYWVQTGNTIEAGFNVWAQYHPHYTGDYVGLHGRGWTNSARKWMTYSSLDEGYNIICEA